MRYVFIESEDPLVHWGFVEVMDKVVLDLGCGYFGAETTNTPQFFLENGASYVVGVDMSLSGLESVNDPNIALIEMSIDSALEVSKLYERFQPQVVKCDVEGAEVYLAELHEAVFKWPEQYAIEVHSDDLDELLTRKLRGCGYKIKTVADIVHAPGCKVLHAVR